MVDFDRPLDQRYIYNDVDFLLSKYSSINLEEINVGVMLTDILNSVNEHGITLPSSITVLVRGLVTIEGVLSFLTDDINVMDILKDYIFEYIKETKSWKMDLQQAVQNILTSVQKGIELPVLSNDVLRSILKGQIKVNMSFEQTNFVVNKLIQVVSSLIICFIICALLIASSICCLLANITPQFLGIPLICYFSSGIAIVLSVILFAKNNHF